MKKKVIDIIKIITYNNSIKIDKKITIKFYQSFSM